MFSPGLVVSGDVTLHNDGDQHIAVILDVVEDECEALFFTSNPDWAEKSRLATREEIAMAGFICSRPTYLAYVVRSCWDFSSMGRTFPDHWIDALRQEFSSARQRVQVGS